MIMKGKKIKKDKKSNNNNKRESKISEDLGF